MHHASRCLFALVTACLCGCSTVGGPRGKEARDVQQNHKTIVLVRMVCADDVPGLPHRRWNFVLDSWRMDKPNGQMELSPHHERPSQRLLSKSLRGQGWFYLVMDPGNYCLEFSAADAYVAISDDDNDPRPFYYLSVPANKKLVYAGTVDFELRTGTQKKNVGIALSLNRISDESRAAEAAVGDEFAGFGEMTPHLLVPYDTAEINTNQTVDAESNPANSLTATPVVKGDNWRPAQLAALPFLESGKFLVQAGVDSGDSDGGYVVAAGGAMYLIAAPLVFTTEGITAEVHRKRWAPYEAALRRQVAAFHFEEKLQQALAKRLSTASTNLTSMPSLRLETRPYRIILRGDEHQNFNVEVAARVRLWNTAERRAVWEQDYLCTYDPPNSLPDYQTFIPSWYGQHQLEEYRGDAGDKLVVHELESAVGAITDQVIGQLYQRNSASSSDQIDENVVVTGETPPQSPH